MDIGKFVEFTKEVCSDFIKNSNSNSVVLYGGSHAMLKFFSETMQENFISQGKKINITIDEKINPEYAREKYLESYLINLDSLLESYSKH